MVEQSIWQLQVQNKENRNDWKTYLEFEDIDAAEFYLIEWSKKNKVRLVQLKTFVVSNISATVGEVK